VCGGSPRINEAIKQVETMKMKKQKNMMSWRKRVVETFRAVVSTRVLS